MQDGASNDDNNFTIARRKIEPNARQLMIITIARNCKFWKRVSRRITSAGNSALSP